MKELPLTLGDRGYIRPSCCKKLQVNERKGKPGSNFHARQKAVKFAFFLLGAKEADLPFVVNRNEFVVPHCLRQYLGLAVRCRRKDFLPMMNNLLVKFRKMTIKIVVVVVITLKEVSAANSREERFWNILPRCV